MSETTKVSRAQGHIFVVFVVSRLTEAMSWLRFLTDIARAVAKSYSSDAMSGRFALLFCLFALLPIPVDPAWADEPAPAPPEQVVVLRNGEVLTGHVATQGDRYVVTRPGSEFRLPARDVDLVCQSLDEAYQLQRNRVMTGRIEDRLNLADWCLRQKLVGYAARELSAAMEIDAANPRVALLDRRLRRAQDAQTETPPPVIDQSVRSPQPISTEELERLTRCLPGNTVETFTATIQPILLNSCATAGCHGPSATSKYALLRPSPGQSLPRRMTQRNLYNTLQWVDHARPAESKLLLAALEPHGSKQPTGVAGISAMRYQELATWVFQATQGIKANVAGTNSAITPPTPFQGVLPATLALPLENSTTAADSVTPVASKLAALKARKPGPAAGVKSVAPLQKLNDPAGLKPTSNPDTPPRFSPSN